MIILWILEKFAKELINNSYINDNNVEVQQIPKNKNIPHIGDVPTHATEYD